MQRLGSMKKWRSAGFIEKDCTRTGKRPSEVNGLFGFPINEAQRSKRIDLTGHSMGGKSQQRPYGLCMNPLKELSHEFDITSTHLLFGCSAPGVSDLRLCWAKQQFIDFVGCGESTVRPGCVRE